MKREGIVVELDRHDFLAIQGHIDLAKALLAEYGLSLHVDHDMQAFCDYIGSQHDTHGVPNSHDPRKSYLHPDNSFWVYVRHDASGDIIACHAQRLIVTDNFAHDCLSHTLFENLYPKIDAEPPGDAHTVGDGDPGGVVLVGGHLLGRVGAADALAVLEADQVQHHGRAVLVRRRVGYVGPVDERRELIQVRLLRHALNAEMKARRRQTPAKLAERPDGGDHPVEARTLA